MFLRIPARNSNFRGGNDRNILIVLFFWETDRGPVSGIGVSDVGLGAEYGMIPLHSPKEAAKQHVPTNPSTKFQFSWWRRQQYADCTIFLGDRDGRSFRIRCQRRCAGSRTWYDSLAQSKRNGKTACSYESQHEILIFVVGTTGTY